MTAIIKKVEAALSLIAVAAALALAQQPQQAIVSPPDGPWVVSVVHTVDLYKLLTRLREQQKMRVGVPGSSPQNIINIATGLVVDGEGHVITRLAYLDPKDKDQKISITTSQGVSLPARLIGVDCATGFAVLKVEQLNAPVPEFAPASAAPVGTEVRILSTDVVPKIVSDEKNSQVYIAQSLKVFQGRIAPENLFSKARGALSLDSGSLLSRNDSSVVTTFSNKVLGMVQYAGYGRAYLFPIEYIHNTVARRVLESNDSVPAGWLGIVGENLTRATDAEMSALGLDRKSGVIVREVKDDSPAARGGLQPSDVIVGLDGLDITGTADLGAMLSSSPAGRNVKFKTIRNRQPLEIAVALGARPITGPTLSLLMPEQYGEPLAEQHAQLEARLSELANQYRGRMQLPASIERSEALRELEIEIRQLQDRLRALDQMRVPDPEITAANDSSEPPERYTSQARDCFYSVGFFGRNLTKQLAVFFGAESGVMVTKLVAGGAADIAGIKVGDVIVGTEKQDLATCSQLANIFSIQRGVIPLKIVRDKQLIAIKIIIAEKQ